MLCLTWSGSTRPSPKESIAEVRAAALADLQRWIEARGFAGYDPFDALNSPILKAMALNRKSLQIAVLQAFKRCPVNLRPLFLVPPGVNPKALGLLLSCYTLLERMEGQGRYLPTLADLRQRLLDLAPGGGGPAGWGYNFDWPNRSLFVPKGTPTAVNTAYVIMGLCDAHGLTEDSRFLELAVRAAGFLHRGLNLSYRAEDQECSSYTPIDHTCVHNASLLSAAAMYRVSQLTGDSALAGAACRRIRFSLASQQADGSWRYGEAANQGWVDSFHTGYNLLALHVCRESELRVQIQAAMDRGLRFYRDNFFLPDGTVKYYHDKTHPLDAHAFAHALLTLTHLESADAAGMPMADLVEQRLFGLFRLPSGAFAYQRTNFSVNRIEYMRWVQVWVLYALLVREIVDKEGTASLPWAPARP